MMMQARAQETTMSNQPKQNVNRNTTTNDIKMARTRTRANTRVPRQTTQASLSNDTVERSENIAEFSGELEIVPENISREGETSEQESDRAIVQVCCFKFICD